MAPPIMSIASEARVHIAPPRLRRYYLRMQVPGARLVYPAASRRSGGLSLGVDLFPDAKLCSFDCPYCEIFLRSDPSLKPSAGFSVEALRNELDAFLDEGYAARWAPEPLRDLCISGNGEPTASPFLGRALELCARARRSRPELLSDACLVVITNSAGFFDPRVCALLERFSREEGLVIWAKLDAGSEDRFRLMSGSQIGLERLAGGLLGFARRAPVVIQTMLCEVDGVGPAEAELADYSSLVRRLVDGGALIEEAHL